MCLWMGVYTYQIISLLVRMESARWLSVTLCAVKTFVLPQCCGVCLRNVMLRNQEAEEEDTVRDSVGN